MATFDTPNLGRCWTLLRTHDDRLCCGWFVAVYRKIIRFLYCNNSSFISTWFIKIPLKVCGFLSEALPSSPPSETRAHKPQTSSTAFSSSLSKTRHSSTSSIICWRDRIVFLLHFRSFRLFMDRRRLVPLLDFVLRRNWGIWLALSRSRQKTPNPNSGSWVWMGYQQFTPPQWFYRLKRQKLVTHYFLLGLGSFSQRIGWSRKNCHL